MSPPISLRIDELGLDGVAAGEEAAILDAAHAELDAWIAEPGRTRIGAGVSVLPALEPILVAPDADPAEIGSAIARAVVAALTEAS